MKRVALMVAILCCCAVSSFAQVNPDSKGEADRIGRDGGRVRVNSGGAVDIITPSGKQITLKGISTFENFLESIGITAPAVAPVGRGRIYFDSSTNKYRVSQNGGAYVDLISEGATANTTVGAIPYLSATDVYADSPLFRPDANTLEQRNGTNAQQLFVYGTYGASNTKYARVTADSTGATFAADSSGTFPTASLNVTLLPRGSGIVTAPSIIKSSSGGFRFPDDTTQTTRAPTLSASANAVPKSDGTNLVASQISDDGTDVIIDSQSGGVIQLSTTGFVSLGDVGGAGNGTSISVEDTTQRVVIFSPGYTQVQGQLRVTAGIKVGDGGPRPTCDSTVRGLVWNDEGGAGVKDSIAVCSKDASDVYAWRTIY